MKPSRHPKDRAYYEDLYDRNTVEICRMEEESRMCYPPPGTKATKSEIRRENNKIWPKLLRELALMQVTGERYAERERTIARWMADNRRRDEQLEQASPPEEVCCKDCDALMSFETKFLHENSLKLQEQVLFLFRCLCCKNGRGIFQDGTEWQAPQPDFCKQCNVVLTRTHTRKGDQAITICRCRRCGYEERSVLDLRPAKKPSAAEERRFVRDRKRYCLSKEKGEQHIKDRRVGRILTPHSMDESLEDRENRQAARQLKKTSISVLERMLKSALSKKGYVRLRFQAPEVERDVIVKFLVHDEKDRSDYESRRTLEKCIEASLHETNWRLMSDGVNYRLGILRGRLRGYECEEDLMELIRVRKKNTP